jgi:hypothetical protein
MMLLVIITIHGSLARFLYFATMLVLSFELVWVNQASLNPARGKRGPSPAFGWYHATRLAIRSSSRSETKFRQQHQQQQRWRHVSHRHPCVRNGFKTMGSYTPVVTAPWCFQGRREGVGS